MPSEGGGPSSGRMSQEGRGLHLHRSDPSSYTGFRSILFVILCFDDIIALGEAAEVFSLSCHRQI